MVVSNSNTHRMLRSPRASVISACSIVAAFAFGCGSRPSESEISHDVDQPTRGTQSWHWFDVSDQAYHGVITPLIGLDNTQYLDKDHELTVWVQKWVDLIDSKVRSEHPSKLANTPKPIAKVIKEKSANAFVAPIPVCYDVNVKLKSGSPTATNTVDNVFLNAKAGEFSSWPNHYTCVGASNDKAEIESYIADYNASSVGCKFKLNSDGILEGNSKCSLSSDINGAVAAKKLVLLQTANYVTIHTGIFGLMTEEALISVIAHELGHYYRSHVAGAMKDFDFFYTLGEQNTASRPVAEADKKEMGDNAVVASTLLNATDSYTVVPGQKIRPELYMAVGSTIATACRSDNCPDTCKAALEEMKSSEFNSDMATYPFAGLEPDMKTSYLAYEEKALACLGDISMASSGTTMKPDSIGYAKFRSFIENPTWPSWLGRVGAGGRRYLAQMSRLAAIRAGETAPEGESLKAVVDSLSRTLADQDDESVDALKIAHENRLGQYTSEQEADDVAAEWVNDVGISPKHVVDAMRRLGRGTTTSLRGFILSEQDCDALWSRNWLDDSGKYAFVPIGNYAQVHHSSCYRMFNLDREIAAHNYVTPAPAAPLIGEAGWRKMQEKAIALSAGVPEVEIERDAAEILKQSSMGSCSYSYSFH